MKLSKKTKRSSRSRMQNRAGKPAGNQPFFFQGKDDLGAVQVPRNRAARRMAAKIMYRKTSG